MTRHFDRKLREVSYSLALLTQQVPYKMESVTRRVTVICRVTVIYCRAAVIMKTAPFVCSRTICSRLLSKASARSAYDPLASGIWWFISRLRYKTLSQRDVIKLRREDAITVA